MIFLNGYLHEEVYMVSPIGVSYNHRKVCKLKKNIYGLKQALQAWVEKFTTIIISLGFCSSDHDPVYLS